MRDTFLINVLYASLVPMIAIIASYIAYRQWRTAQNKLKIELFDKRFAIYEVVINYIHNSARSKETNEMTGEFLYRAREAKWLLNENVYLYLIDEVWVHVLRLESLEKEKQETEDEKEIDNIIDQQQKVRFWFNFQYSIVDKMFSPFLNVYH